MIQFFLLLALIFIILLLIPKTRMYILLAGLGAITLFFFGVIGFYLIWFSFGAIIFLGILSLFAVAIIKIQEKYPFFRKHVGWIFIGGPGLIIVIGAFLWASLNAR